MLSLVRSLGLVYSPPCLRTFLLHMPPSIIVLYGYTLGGLGKHLPEQFILKSCYILKCSCPTLLRQSGIQDRAHSLQSLKQSLSSTAQHISHTRLNGLPRFRDTVLLHPP